MLIYPICIAFDSNGETIIVGVNRYLKGMIIPNSTAYGPETADSKTVYLRLCKFVESKCIIQLSPEGEVNIGVYIPRREASRYISTALH